MDSNEKNINLKQAVFIIAASVIIVMFVLNFDAACAAIGRFASILTPFILGGAIAYITNILMSFIETRLWKKKYGKNALNKLKRVVCMIISLAAIIGILVAVFALLIPQIASSAVTFAQNMPSYFEHIQKSASETVTRFGLSMDDLKNLQVNWQGIIDKLTNFLGSFSTTLFSFASGVTNIVFNVILGLFFAIYMLLGKESLKSGYRRIVLTFFPKKASGIFKVSSLSNDVFRAFVIGQLTECAILAVMYFAGLSIAGIPYAVLIAFIMALGAIVPQFGPIFAAIPSAFLLLLVNPGDAVIFVIMAVVFQQVEGNIIYPFIIGDKLGLPGILVLLAVLIGGGTFGVAGMILAVPLTSVLYRLAREKIHNTLDTKPKNSDNKAAK